MIQERGSSPLTRGKLETRPQRGLQARLIPAHAGKTTASPGANAARPAHPRSRGENAHFVRSVVRACGSSPLTRGKLHALLRSVVGGGLIPAHAGKTPPYGPSRRPYGAHPRSRGENSSSPSWSVDFRGSSPLTRGKPQIIDPSPLPVGLIPAHAGKTVSTARAMSYTRAHPRSRGENRLREAAHPARVGSSPLTRGKPLIPEPDSDRRWLIPAHAGKTGARSPGFVVGTAHPRSRGENLWGGVGSCYTLGSSPLTRGKRGGLSAHQFLVRLIPAHAGKTSGAVAVVGHDGAHPRSRGENFHCSVPLAAVEGSSPLTRGKPWCGVRGGEPGGLIPAHAGKTAGWTSNASRTAAHPRSRGENALILARRRREYGSSPLTRGKRINWQTLQRLVRLIPAHAGKTASTPRAGPSPAAHPRSRGENSSGQGYTTGEAGSSPLTRGKRLRGRRRRGRGRLIPAHAGKTTPS